MMAIDPRMGFRWILDKSTTTYNQHLSTKYWYSTSHPPFHPTASAKCVSAGGNECAKDHLLQVLKELRVNAAVEKPVEVMEMVGICRNILI